MQIKPKSLLCVGSPLLDLSMEANEQFLSRHDYQLNNTYRVKSDDPIFSYIIESKTYNKIAGGQTLNSLRVAQWMFPDHQSEFIGSVGDDLYSQLLRDSCLKDNVQPVFDVLPAQATGKCAVLLSNNDRCCITSLGASGNLTERFVDSHMDQIKQADLFLGEVYFLYANPELNKKVFKICSENDVRVCIALGAVNAIKDNFHHLKELIPYVDYMFGNRSEYEELARQYGIEYTNIGEVGAEIAKMSKINNKRERVCIITQKSNPIVATKDKIVYFDVEPLESSKIVDTNSAGDAFCGGFIGQLINYSENEIDFEKCISAGHYAAIEIIQQIGCTLPDYKSQFAN